jgi:endonuclease G
MNALRRFALAAAAALMPALSDAAETSCPQHFVGGTAPDLANPKLAPHTRELCYSEFAILHSGVTRTPLWSAEHLTRAQVDTARALDREGTFHPDPKLPKGERAELADYARSGFDRGHMAPSGDMPDRQAQQESFSLANIVPQNPDNNRNLWSDIEAAVRRLARREGVVYVVTGPIFQGEDLQQLNGRVLVPTHVFKAIYVPRRQQAGAYVAPNAPGHAWKAVSIAELEQLTGIDVFPTLSAAVKATSMALPDPVPPRRKPRQRATGPAAASGADPLP